MAYVLIENDVVVQKQPNEQDGFVKVHDDIVCGMIHSGGESFAKTSFSAPEIVVKEKTNIELIAETESVGVVARKLEEIIDYIENDTPLSTYTKNWLSERKGLRG